MQVTNLAGCHRHCRRWQPRLALLMTPEAKSSEYVTYEWAFAWGVGIKVIPIMLRATQLHPRLEALQYLDFTNAKSRPWDRLIEEMRAAFNAPLTTR